MTRHWLSIVIAFVFALYPIQASAECAELRNANRWQRVDRDEILIFNRDRPLALIRFRGCRLYRHSDVTILKDRICSYEDDALLIDGEVCDAGRVEDLDD